MERIDPINTHDQDDRECAGCGEAADRRETINGQSIDVCGDCLHDSIFRCPDCLERFWIADGYRLTSKEIICGGCAAWRPREVEGRMRELRVDESRDEFNQVRR